MWTIEIVKARFIEAADIERRMIVKGTGGGGSAWPAYYYDHEDMAGWDDQAIADNLERWQGRKITKSPELTRWEEVFFDWTQLMPEGRRLLVWRWSQAIAGGWSFSEWCQKKGIVRRTAYNRIEKVFLDLAACFGNEARLLRYPDEKWASQLCPDQAPIDGTMGEAVKVTAKGHQPFRTERHRDALTTPEAVDAFSQHLADTNDRRRKARLRKALRGVPGEHDGTDAKAA